MNVCICIVLIRAVVTGVVEMTLTTLVFDRIQGKTFEMLLLSCTFPMQPFQFWKAIRGHQGAQGALDPPKNSKSGFTPPKRSAHPSRVRRGCFDPPSPKIEAVGCANPYPPWKNFEPSKKIFHSGR